MRHFFFCFTLFSKLSVTYLSYTSMFMLFIKVLWYLDLVKYENTRIHVINGFTTDSNAIHLLLLSRCASLNTHSAQIQPVIYYIVRNVGISKILNKCWTTFESVLTDPLVAFKCLRKISLLLPPIHLYIQ